METLKEKIEKHFVENQYNNQEKPLDQLKPDVIKYLKTLDPNNEEDFTTAIMIAVHYIPKINFAREFGVSRPTLERYIDGKNAPHPVLRPAVIDYILNQLSE